MSRDLQKRGFQESPYERPTQEWVCGWASHGRPCRQGPALGGRCTVTHECTPARRGERWQCTRPAPYGGACEKGPLPGGTCCRPVPRCQPVRSLRAQRGRVSRWAAAVTFALLIFSVSGSGGNRVVSPGPVGTQHGPIEEDCGECHTAGVGGPSHWFSAAFSFPAGDATGPTESALCQECHDLGPSSLHPHSVSPAALALETEEAVEQGSYGRTPLLLSLASLGPGPARDPDGQLPCATCHREHRGRANDITRLSNDQCQVCHENKFASFGSGHPPFSVYPYKRRTRIRFNHGTHRKDHFPQEGQEFECRGCHQPDRAGQVMLVSGFEENCAGCHEEDVEVADGIPFLQLPGLDTELLGDSGVGIGQWPELADLDLEASFSPYLRIMLAADPANAAAFQALPGAPDELVFPLLGGDEDEARAVGQIVWAVKDLLYQLATRKQAALKEHLDSGLRRTMDESELARLSASFDFELVENAVAAWFPDLGREIAGQQREADATGSFALDRMRTQLVATDLASTGPVWGWAIDPATYSIRYRPRGHADPFMQAWLDAVIEPSELANVGALEYAVAALATREAAGHCAKCHSVDATDSITTVNWRQKHRELRERGFTRYLHRPHLIQPRLRTCVACHSMGDEAPAEAVAEVDVEMLDSEGNAVEAEAAEVVAVEGIDRTKAYASGFDDNDPSTFTSNFEPLDQETCRSCHRAGAASNSCLNCHNYHVHSAVLQGVQANLELPPVEVDSGS